MRIFVGARTVFVIAMPWVSGLVEGAREGFVEVAVEPPFEETFNLPKALLEAVAGIGTEESFGSATVPGADLSSVDFV